MTDDMKQTCIFCEREFPTLEMDAVIVTETDEKHPCCPECLSEKIESGEAVYSDDE